MPYDQSLSSQIKLNEQPDNNDNFFEMLTNSPIRKLFFFRVSLQHFPKFRVLSSKAFGIGTLSKLSSRLLDSFSFKFRVQFC